MCISLNRRLETLLWIHTVSTIDLYSDHSLTNSVPKSLLTKLKDKSYPVFVLFCQTNCVFILSFMFFELQDDTITTWMFQARTIIKYSLKQIFIFSFLKFNKSINTVTSLFIKDFIQNIFSYSYLSPPKSALCWFHFIEFKLDWIALDYLKRK